MRSTPMTKKNIQRTNSAHPPRPRHDRQLSSVRASPADPSRLRASEMVQLHWLVASTLSGTVMHPDRRVDAARCVNVNHHPDGNPNRKVWWVQQQAFPSERNQGLIVSRKKPNSRRWCWLASRQLWTIYKAPRPVLCFTSCNAEPAHNTTKYFAPNLRWGCWWRGDDGVKASSLIHGNGDRKLLCQVDVRICSK
jgi:hypothetical protein